jgi:hypothetical protein
MVTGESLKDIERRAYRSTFQDGFTDIAWACLFLIFAWIPVLDVVGISRFYAYPFVLVPALIVWLGKRYVTVPRMGAVEFGPARKSHRRYTAIIGIIALLLMLPLIIMMFAGGVPARPTWMTAGIIAAPAVAIGVILLRFSRMYIYAMLFLFSIVASEFLRAYVARPYESLVAFGIPGVLISVYGFYLLFGFMREYPRPGPEVPYVS